MESVSVEALRIAWKCVELSNCNIPKRVGYKYTTTQNLTVMLLQLRCR